MPARRAVRQPVADRHVPGIARPGVLHVERELPPLAQIQCAPERRGAGLGHQSRGAAIVSGGEMPPLARKRLVEHAVDQPSEVPLRGIHELRADRVDRRVVEHDRQA
jgi:hypothetical protein